MRSSVVSAFFVTGLLSQVWAHRNEAVSTDHDGENPLLAMNVLEPIWTNSGDPSDNRGYWERLLQGSSSFPPPVTDSRIESITFGYFCEGDDTCIYSENSQNSQTGAYFCGDESSCRVDQDIFIVMNDEVTNEQIYQGMVPDGGSFTVNGPKKALDITLYQILQNNSRNLVVTRQTQGQRVDRIQTLKMSTSCSDDTTLIRVGDQFGYLHVIGLNINEDDVLSRDISNSNIDPACSCTSSTDTVDESDTCNTFLGKFLNLKLTRNKETTKSTKAPKKTTKSTKAPTLPKSSKTTKAPKNIKKTKSPNKTHKAKREQKGLEGKKDGDKKKGVDKFR